MTDSIGRAIITLMLALCGLMLCWLVTTWVQIVVSVCGGGRVSDDNLYKIINALTRIRKDGSQHRDVIATEWFASYKERSYNSHMARCNSPYQNTALVACPALKVQEHQEMMEYMDEYDDDYSDPPMLRGWFIVWMFGDVTRDDVTSKMYG